MRIIAGLYRGRVIRTVKDLSVRPATDRVRQAIFDMLAARMQLTGIDVLDLYAGSGSLGLEALSRGARRATFVEQSREAVRILEANIAALGCGKYAEVVRRDVADYVDHARESFDLVFADPPYAFDGTALLPERIFSQATVRPGGFLLIEHARDLSFGRTGLYTAGPARRFGRTVVTFFQCATMPEDARP